MVAETESSLLDLIKLVAKRRSRVMFSGPWPVRKVQRSSSQFQSQTT